MAIGLPKTRGMLRREAATWLARLQSGRNPDVEAEFSRWRDADPRHGAAFDRVRQSYEQAGLLRHSPGLLSSKPESTIRKPEWRLRPALAAAAAIAVLLPAGTLLLRNGSLEFGGTNELMLMTSVGEIKQVKLADGSILTLDTLTKVDVEIGRSRRSAHLRYGRARFQIARASSPFVVETARTTISAQQGVLDVEQIGEQDRVQVLAGAAEVAESDTRQRSHFALSSGEGVAVNAGGGGQKSLAAPSHDWTKGMLQFDGTPLAEAVALANRYSERRLILGTDLNALRVTGAFRAGDTAGLAKALAAAFGLSLEQRPDGNLVLSRRTPSGH